MTTDLPPTHDPPATTAPARRLPVVQRVELSAFSLYALRPDAAVEFDEQVSCVAGANGIGKSTLIAAINFGLTGRVPPPARKLESLEEYYKYTVDFSREYFAGRISERDRDVAQIEVVFTIGNTQFRVVRGVFQPEELLALTISPASADDDNFDFSDASPTQLHAHYEKRVAQEAGLETFDQFVFLQLFLLTFDERRHLLFWDERALEQILFLAFGVDPRDARHADALRRREERMDSNVRNAQWQATQAQNALTNLQRRIEDLSEPDTSLIEELEELEEGVRTAEVRFDDARAGYDDAELELQSLAARDAALDSQYQGVFARLTERPTDPRAHPVVASILNTAVCPVCSSSGDQIRTRVQQYLDESKCPLCLSATVTTDDPDVLGELVAVDEQRSEVRRSLAEAARRRERVRAEMVEAQDALESARRALRKFEGDHSDESAVRGVEHFDALVQSYRQTIELAKQKRQKAYLQREEARQQLSQLQRAIQRRYLEAESHFVPRFRRLAYAFLGLDLSVRLDARASSARMQLVLEVRGQVRRAQHQLSESQRFFVDIALRMAIAEYLVGDGRAMLLIDTPEGSLDIAYEKRAGEMFALFVRRNNSIIMTANVNTSKLLQRLAQECGSSRMKLVRMTDWAVLSDVQAREQNLFQEAFSDIETELIHGAA